MATLSQDSKPFLERAGLIPARRGPRLRIDLSRHPIHRQVLDPPLPAGELASADNGLPPPDRGLTRLWPFTPAV